MANPCPRAAVAAVLLPLLAGLAAPGFASPVGLGGDPPVPGLLPAEEGCGGGGDGPCPGGADGGNGKLTSEAATDRLLAVGAPAAGFELPDPAGNPLSFRPGGRPVLLVFWSMFCEPCQDELPVLGEAAGPGVEILSVNLDEERLGAAVAQYVKRNGLAFPVVLDRRLGKVFRVAEAYGVAGTPSLFLIGADGTVRWRHAGRLDPEVFEREVSRFRGG